MKINELPDELIDQVACWLGKGDFFSCSLVCKRWQQISLNSRRKFSFLILQDESASKEAKFATFCNGLKALAEAKRKYRSLIIDNVAIDFRTRHVVSENLNFGLNLDSIQFTECFLNDQDLFNLVSKCPRLKELKLNNSVNIMEKPKRGQIDDDDTLIDARHVLSKIRRLDLSGGNGFSLSDAFFVNLADQCIELQELDISGCKVNFQRGIIRRFYSDSTDYWNKPTSFSFTFPIILHFLNHIAPQLKTIYLSNTHILDDSLRSLASIDHLEKIVLEQCNELSKRCIEEIKKNRPNLELIWTSSSSS